MTQPLNLVCIRNPFQGEKFLLKFNHPVSVLIYFLITWILITLVNFLRFLHNCIHEFQVSVSGMSGRGCLMYSALSWWQNSRAKFPGFWVISANVVIRLLRIVWNLAWQLSISFLSPSVLAYLSGCPVSLW